MSVSTLRRDLAHIRRQVGTGQDNDIKDYTDAVSFAADRLGWTPDKWQENLLRSKSDRLLLNCSRQSGKSTTAALLALHQAVHNPGLILLVSPTLRQSRELFAKVSGFLRQLKPRQRLTEDNKLSFTLANGSRVVCLPGSADNIRGFSAPSLVIEDEAAFVDDALYVAVRPMLAVSGGRLILMSTPFGKRGHFYEAWISGENWKRIEITAKECPRISAEFLEREYTALGEWWFRQEYLCQFVETSDQVFRQKDIDAAFDADIAPLLPDEESTDNKSVPMLLRGYL